MKDKVLRKLMEKNIFLIPTDKPSRLFKLYSQEDELLLGNSSIKLCTEDKNLLQLPQNIYITNDELIKSSNDFFIDIHDDRNHIHQVGYDIEDNAWTEQYDPLYFKKIILTTDNELIANGVQEIPNEFLEWFVNNSSCEYVKVEKIELNIDYTSDWNQKFRYKIIIPHLEIWKDIPDYNSLYQLSNLGNVRSLNYGKIRELKPRLVGYDGNQYFAVNLSKESEVKSVKVHKLVALCFLNHTSKGYDGLVIDHIDSNKLNNRLDNLKLVTPRFNASKDKQGSSSKFTGVTWHKKSKKWQCQIYDNGKLNHLGLFNTEIEASKMYNNYLENMTKEEPKQDFPMQWLIDKMENDEELKLKTELEEAAENYGDVHMDKFDLTKAIHLPFQYNDRNKVESAFIAGAKYQAERMYSEEEVMNILDQHTAYLFGEKQNLLLKEWFEQFKKK